MSICLDFLLSTFIISLHYTFPHYTSPGHRRLPLHRTQCHNRPSSNRYLTYDSIHSSTMLIFLLRNERLQTRGTCQCLYTAHSMPLFSSGRFNIGARVSFLFSFAVAHGLAPYVYMPDVPGTVTMLLHSVHYNGRCCVSIKHER